MEKPKGDTQLCWNDMFLLGYEAMDETHREFVAAVANLQEAEDDRLESALHEVLDHLERHFRQENNWMQDTNYPAVACHVAEHNAVLSSGQDVREALSRGDLALCRRYGDELAAWFPGHADYLDAPLAQWLTHKRFGGVPIVVKRNAAR